MASALNALLRASADVDKNYCIGIGGEKLVEALVKLFDEAIGWDEADDEVDYDTNANLDPTVKTWDADSLTGKNKRWRDFCRDKLASPLASSTDPTLLIDPETDAKVLEMIVAILRNLSYVAQNLRFLYHSEGVLRILTGALYYRGYSLGGGGSGDDRGGEDKLSSWSHLSNMCVQSVQTLINMAPLIDVTGRQIFIDRIFLEAHDSKEVLCTIPDQQPPPSNEGGGAAAAPVAAKKKNYGMSTFLGFGGMHLAKQYDTKAETLENIPNSAIWELVGSHVRAILSIFPALSAILDPNDITTMSTSASGWHRPSVQAVLELMTALVENSDNKDVFLCVPDAVLHRLTGLLFMPRLGPDSMDYIDPVSNVVTRVVALKLQMGYDATIDSDMRDRACELLAKLTDLSLGIKRRLGMASSISSMAQRENDDSNVLAPSILQSDQISSPRRMNVRLYESLLSMISSSSGDAASLAVRLLSNLALVPENKAGMLYVETKLITMSGKDPHIANIACNGILNRIK